jgi:flagellar biosynthesis/type III secretory pathway M-ring protein FliF/YscJ
LRQQVKAIIELGVVFSIVVVFLDFFLGSIQILSWVALSITFALFAALILDSVSRLIPRSTVRTSNVPERRDGDQQRLERTLERAIAKHDPESAKVLGERLRSVIFGMTAYRTGLSESELRQLAEQNPESLAAIVRDEQIREILQAHEPVLRTGASREIAAILTKVESGSV